jgi:hypothetical protein
MQFETASIPGIGIRRIGEVPTAEERPRGKERGEFSFVELCGSLLFVIEIDAQVMSVDFHPFSRCF